MTIEELADFVGISVRTVRYYISARLLPGPGTRGRGTRYTEAHLSRLRLIRSLVDQHVPINEIRDRMLGLSEPEVLRLQSVIDRQQRALTRASESASGREYIEALIRRRTGSREASSPATEEPTSAGTDARLTSRLSRHANVLAFVQPSDLNQEVPASSVPTVGERSEASAWHRILVSDGVEVHVTDDRWRTQRQVIMETVRRLRGETT
ncbi:MAG: MerR family transcriptional regulator [Proteobacteria bacterium]|jgi:DNA-binding transcriptional MerR regulator|nr:MerR family transcriptional regulator [Pseudomonadota bacterium]NBT93600.1 MerR family transcriptional regulator [Chloroflexota bacterium]NBQ31278.1 MerR family transcriptional regulator [Pseudomonadota bacterium]NBT02211.1 MerR family transcriptional regulator [Pseudomonadota bacterium]NBT17593.1 MerR family transcriptional regulator [Pseudomonadota bacterium]